MAIPLKSMVVTGTLFPILAILYTKKTTVMAPTNAKRVIVEIPNTFMPPNATIPKVAPNAAPEEIPSI